MEDRDADTDIHNFSNSPSQHRLPTVSGIEALQSASAKARGIPSGLPALDSLLPPGDLAIATPGIQRGHVTEVFGPPGVGKTTFALQVAINTLLSPIDDSHVLWVNTGSPLIEERMHELLQASLEGGNNTTTNDASPDSSLPVLGDAKSLLQDKFMYLEASSLPRVLTLFLHPTRSCPSPKTSLIVVDDLSNLVLGSFTRNPKTLKSSAPAAVREKMEKRAAGRRFRVIESLAAAMSKLAALKRLSVLVLTNATMSFKVGHKATLRPALSSQAWDTAVHTRIMMYRDFPDDEQEDEMADLETRGLRYAEIQRIARKDVYRSPVPFLVLGRGICPLTSGVQQYSTVPDVLEGPLPQTDLPLLPVELSQQSGARKRKAIEIADSEDEPDDEEDDDEHSSALGEPELPRIVLRGGNTVQKQEEMILDAYELSVLRSYRYASIRGSEDALGPYSSSVEEEGSHVEIQDGEADG
ncbi:hypothetical protein HRR83_001873 [Exophiala dermatitidis]|uniref:RecA family profile 1 domain-containing protein n=2 Tax=Exophiala dermatitidis TaxID=5970 RepID=H6C7N9_EXODN|nr:uncharacterized protein HMPREF1120_06871 [Exophiala dermatitidis NIH/UT8656]KAJ4516539.1 hypothetical protein HRR73_005004 [Exophiala dermatitidis]EHY58869.1 hypothetical protein HMPREF1120_06871 [Exophiala dermatitidis NIH/UT8656]KAJ4523326.1 hypothetical protein HRR75_001727 [Exophiala dermatitidis]KAJ4526676.1 hypothetical protein HRR74_001876 [Exophiala dermatitidis]KAJ4532075.1 hypothetical protein HRR76_007075 [Exophiala dermatitidis]